MDSRLADIDADSGVLVGLHGQAPHTVVVLAVGGGVGSVPLHREHAVRIVVIYGVGNGGPFRGCHVGQAGVDGMVAAVDILAQGVIPLSDGADLGVDGPDVGILAPFSGGEYVGAQIVGQASQAVGVKKLDGELRHIEVSSVLMEFADGIKKFRADESPPEFLDSLAFAYTVDMNPETVEVGIFDFVDILGGKYGAGLAETLFEKFRCGAFLRRLYVIDAFGGYIHSHFLVSFLGGRVAGKNHRQQYRDGQFKE